MSKLFPQLFIISIDTLKQKIDNLTTLYYTKEDIIKMTKSFPAIIGYSIENMKQKINDLNEIGYPEDDIIKMSKCLPQIFGYSTKSIKQKIESLTSMGYKKDDVINATKKIPQLFSYSLENLKGKIEFYDSINLHDLLVVNPKQLIQSTALSYAKYMFYKDKGIEINMDNHKKLFISNNQFEKTYKITKVELLQKYDYNKYIEEINGGKKCLNYTI